MGEAFKVAGEGERKGRLSEKGRKWNTFEEEHVYNTVHEDLGITILDTSGEERLLSTIVTRQRSHKMDLIPRSPLGALSFSALPCF